MKYGGWTTRIIEYIFIVNVTNNIGGKMKIFNKKIIITISLFIVVMIVIVFFRQRYLMEKYCDIPEVTVKMGQPIIYNGYSISVTRAILWDDEDYYEHLGSGYTKYKKYIVEDSMESKIIELTIHVEKLEEKNNSAECGIYDFSLISGAAIISADMMIAQMINDDWKEISDIETGESYDYIVPYFLYENGFSSKQWDNLYGLKYEYFLSIYPQKQVIIVDNIEEGKINIDNEISTNLDDNYEVEITENNNQLSEDEIESVDNEIVDMQAISNVYSCDSIVNVGGIEYEINNIDIIYDYDEIQELFDEGKFTSLYNGYSPNDEICYIKYMVNMKNISDKPITVNLSDSCISNSTTSYNEICGELLYSSIYNNDTQDENRIFFITLQPGESIECTKVEDVYIEDVDKGKLYYKILSFEDSKETVDSMAKMYGCYIEINVYGGDNYGDSYKK